MCNILGNSRCRLVVLHAESEVREGVGEGRAEGFVETFVKSEVHDFRRDRSSRINNGCAHGSRC